jgi:hypothetical protein
MPSLRLVIASSGQADIQGALLQCLQVIGIKSITSFPAAFLGPTVFTLIHFGPTGSWFSCLQATSQA